MRSENKSQSVFRVSFASFVFAVALAAMTAACGGAESGSKNASNAASNAANNPANTANVSLDVKGSNPTSIESDSIDTSPNTAASGKEIKPATDFKLKSIEPLEGTIIVGVLNDYAASLPSPEFPAGTKASGKIPVEVVVNEKGVVSAVSVVEGPQPLRAAASAAAREAKFEPFLHNGKPVKVAGVINYEVAE